MSKIPYDKELHFLTGAIISLLVIIIFSNFRTAFIAGIIAGIVKEIYDRIVYGGFDWEDMVEIWLGSIFAMGIIFIISVWGHIPVM